jgi:hypothetical protein
MKVKCEHCGAHSTSLLPIPVSEAMVRNLWSFLSQFDGRDDDDFRHMQLIVKGIIYERLFQDDTSMELEDDWGPEDED